MKIFTIILEFARSTNAPAKSFKVSSNFIIFIHISSRTEPPSASKRRG
jgi:hypothetical protein